MTINVKELTTYDIGGDGKTVDLNLVDEAGNATRLQFQLPDLGNLLMTLPSLIEAALRRQHRDGSYRFAHPVGGWSIEESNDPASVIVSLRTNDGFGVNFSLRRTDAEKLSDALAGFLPKHDATVH
jgi:hypothetical protein